ncbi:hypothetical protein F444_01474 [Phytophthora nicotianae P1976]|uniref:Uncharacterized protein n=1 Tax=Phytophthora nicotianae P1976 TaxID=1317066 RepID=A0A081B0G6_PHYNI|nr:hypothetical protein F444_01474 [Phytophthora nicotianae P1976]
MGKKIPRYFEDQSPNIRPRQSPREGEYASPSIDLEAQDQAMPEHSTGSEQYQADQQAATGSRTPTDLPTTTGTDQILAQLIQMMATQQQTMMAGQQQMHEFMRQPAAYQTEMFAQQSRANQQKQRANPPKFLGKPSRN